MEFKVHDIRISSSRPNEYLICKCSLDGKYSGSAMLCKSDDWYVRLYFNTSNYESLSRLAEINKETITLTKRYAIIKLGNEYKPRIGNRLIDELSCSLLDDHIVELDECEDFESDLKKENELLLNKIEAIKKTLEGLICQLK